MKIMEKRTTMSLLFYIKKTRLLKNGEAPIYFRITIKSKRADIALNRGIDEKLWSSEVGAAIGNTKEAKMINGYLDSVRTQIHNYMRILREDNKEITVESIKNAYLGIEEIEKGIIELYKEHNENVKKLIGKDFAPETVERYETSLMHTEKFIKLFYKKADLKISQINHKFITDYELYFKTERNCSHNTTMKYIKNFRKIIRIALANGIIKTDPFSNFKMTLKKVDREYLNEEELDILLKKKFDFQRLEQVRDCFLFSCFTGLAHSDLKRLTKENIVTGTDGKLWVKINRKKTNNLSSIPILPITKSLIEKYTNNEYCMTHNVLLPVYTNQKMNAYLKELAILCEINKNLSSHIARHTFATTVTLNNDVPIETVSKMLGHNSINMTRIYARLLDKKVGNDMKHLHDKFAISI